MANQSATHKAGSSVSSVPASNIATANSSRNSTSRGGSLNFSTSINDSSRIVDGGSANPPAGRNGGNQGDTSTNWNQAAALNSALTSMLLEQSSQSQQLLNFMGASGNRTTSIPANPANGNTHPSTHTVNSASSGSTTNANANVNANAKSSTNADTASRISPQLSASSPNGTVSSERNSHGNASHSNNGMYQNFQASQGDTHQQQQQPAGNQANMNNLGQNNQWFAKPAPPPHQQQQQLLNQMSMSSSLNPNNSQGSQAALLNGLAALLQPQQQQQQRMLQSMMSSLFNAGAGVAASNPAPNPMLGIPNGQSQKQQQQQQQPPNHPSKISSNSSVQSKAKKQKESIDSSADVSPDSAPSIDSLPESSVLETRKERKNGVEAQQRRMLGSSIQNRRSTDSSSADGDSDGVVSRSIIPCRARGMPMDHNFKTAFFVVPSTVHHGAQLVCSYPACRNNGIKFRWCQVCLAPVANRNFRGRHSHPETIRQLQQQQHAGPDGLEEASKDQDSKSAKSSSSSPEDSDMASAAKSKNGKSEPKRKLDSITSDRVDTKQEGRKNQQSKAKTKDPDASTGLKSGASQQQSKKHPDSNKKQADSKNSAPSAPTEAPPAASQLRPTIQSPTPRRIAWQKLYDERPRGVEESDELVSSWMMKVLSVSDPDNPPPTDGPSIVQHNDSYSCTSNSSSGQTSTGDENDDKRKVKGGTASTGISSSSGGSSNSNSNIRSEQSTEDDSHSDQKSPSQRGEKMMPKEMILASEADATIDTDESPGKSLSFTSDPALDNKEPTTCKIKFKTESDGSHGMVSRQDSRSMSTLTESSFGRSSSSSSGHNGPFKKRRI